MIIPHNLIHLSFFFLFLILIIILPMDPSFNNNLILIRHGQSNFNKSYLDYLKDRNIDPSSALWENCLHLPGFAEAVCYAKQNIDAPLSP